MALGVGPGPGATVAVGSGWICESADGVLVGAMVAVEVGSESSESLIGVPRLSAGTQVAVIAAVKTRAATANCVTPTIFMNEACYLQKQIWVIWANYSLTLMTP